MRMKAARGRKTSTNLSVRPELVKRARELGLNLSEILDSALERAVREAEKLRWQDENREAIEGYNERVERDGVFSDGWRRF